MASDHVHGDEATIDILESHSSPSPSSRGPVPTQIQMDVEMVNRTKKQVNRHKKKLAKEERRLEREQESASAQAIKPGPASMPLGFASFEKFTNGIGSRLLGKWGWKEGEGLGAQSQGQAHPLLAVQRPKNRGLGADRSQF